MYCHLISDRHADQPDGDGFAGAATLIFAKRTISSCRGIRIHACTSGACDLVIVDSFLFSLQTACLDMVDTVSIDIAADVHIVHQVSDNAL